MNIFSVPRQNLFFILKILGPFLRVLKNSWFRAHEEGEKKRKLKKALRSRTENMFKYNIFIFRAKLNKKKANREKLVKLASSISAAITQIHNTHVKEIAYILPVLNIFEQFFRRRNWFHSKDTVHLQVYTLYRSINHNFLFETQAT